MALPEVDLDDLKSQCANYDYIRFTWSDFHGISRGKTVPARNANDVLESGVGCFAGNLAFGPRSELTMCKRAVKANYCNCYAKPASSKIVHLPWSGGNKYRIGEILCEPTWREDGRVQEASPRYMARQQLKRLESMNLELFSACEQEFLLCKDDKPLFDGTDYCTHLGFSKVEDIMLEIDDHMIKCGIDAETLEVEYSPGQVEMAFKPAKGLHTADAMFRFKTGVKEILKQRGLAATFMSKPFLTEEASSGTHFNHSLWCTKSKKNVFYDPKKPDGISELARFWIGGVMKHMAAITALCCPTTNCYRRLHLPWAPDKINWDFDNRLITWRVKTGSENGTYMENRIPSAASNIYLVMAATLAAGIDGINNKIEPKENGLHANDIPLPNTLEEALKALEEDKTLCESLGEEFVEWFLLEKRTVECKKFQNHNVKVLKEEEFALERKEYFDMV